MRTIKIKTEQTSSGTKTFKKKIGYKIMIMEIKNEEKH